MKPFLTIIIALLCFSTNLFSQLSLQYVLPGAAFEQDIVYADENTIMFTGSNQHQTTLDGGRSWYRYSSSGSFMRAAVFPSLEFGIAVGTSGKYRINKECGYYAAWGPNESIGVSNDLLDVFFRNEQQGFVCGEEGILFRTDDQTENWTTINTNTTNNLNGVWSINDQTMIACGDAGTILFIDENNNVQEQIVGTENFYEVTFTSEMVGYLVGGGSSFYKTTDGGNTWTPKMIDTNIDFLSITFTNENHGVLTGTEGKIYVTEDAGETWITAPTYTDDEIRSTAFENDLEGYACGPTFILRTLDGGHTWRRMTGRLVEIVFPTPDIGYVIGWNGVAYKTYDAGNTWNPLHTGTRNYLNDVDFINKDTGFVVGGFSLYRTLDGGDSWNEIPLPITNSGIQAVDFTDFNHGVVVGSKRTIMHTNDGGVTWEEVSYSAFSSVTYRNVIFVNNDIGFLKNSNGWLYRTTDGGLNWDAVYTDNSNNWAQFFFINESIGWIGGPDGKILKTINGGDDWFLQNAGVAESITSLFFFDENEGIAVGLDGAYVITDDGGDTWEDRSFGSANYGSLVFTDANNGYAISEGGIYKLGAASLLRFTTPICTGATFTFGSTTPYHNNDLTKTLSFQIASIEESFEDAITLSTTEIDSYGIIDFEIPEYLPEGLYKTRLLDVNDSTQFSAERYLKVVPQLELSYTLEGSNLIALPSQDVNLSWYFFDGNMAYKIGTTDTLAITMAGQYRLETERGCCDAEIDWFDVEECNGSLVISSYQQSIEICENQMVEIGNNIYTQPGVYLDSLISTFGCDSILQTTITFAPEIMFAQVAEICEGEIFTVGMNSYSAGGNYLDTLLSVNGCDSIVETELIIFLQEDTLITTIECGPSNQINLTSDTLMTLNGCDSIINLEATIIAFPDVSLGSDTILCAGEILNLSLADGYTYLWNTGDTTSSIFVVTSDEYSVEVTEPINNCLTTTSINVQFDICEDVEDFDNNHNVQLFPSPNDGQFYISTPDEIFNIKILNSLGQIVFEKKSLNDLESIFLVNSGIYFFTFFNGEQNYVIKFLVK